MYNNTFILICKSLDNYLHHSCLYGDKVSLLTLIFHDIPRRRKQEHDSFMEKSLKNAIRLEKDIETAFGREFIGSRRILDNFGSPLRHGLELRSLINSSTNDSAKIRK